MQYVLILWNLLPQDIVYVKSLIGFLKLRLNLYIGKRERVSLQLVKENQKRTSDYSIFHKTSCQQLLPGLWAISQCQHLCFYTKELFLIPCFLFSFANSPSSTFSAHHFP